MNEEPDNIQASIVDQLSSFDDRLASKVDEVELLAEIQNGIGRLLAASGDGDVEIRRVLQDRYENGDLRKETFQLVKSMLDRHVTERVPTSAGTGQDASAIAGTVFFDSDALTNPDSDDTFGATTVIPVNDGIKKVSAEDRVQVGSVLRDRFVLQERVPGGSMGVVYKALDRRLAEAAAAEPWVALKILSPQLATNVQALRALQQEAAKGRCLTHPNIVRFIDLDRDEDLYFIIMEWLEGRTLADLLDSPECGSIEAERAFQIVRQIGKALDYAHRCGIVHADVKPGNIMMMPNGDAKLFDFGVAHVVQKQMHSQADVDPSVLALMTPAYSSMQVLTGDAPVPTDDVFSLGCLLYRLLAGYRVFGPRNAAEAAEAGMTPQRLTSLNDHQWRTLKKALSFSRVTRFSSISDFMTALGEETEEAIGVDVDDEPELEESGGWGKYVFAFVALIILSGVAAYQFGLLEKIERRLAVIETPAIVSVPAVADSAPMPAEVVQADLDILPADVAEKRDAETLIENGVDFSKLPPRTAEIQVVPGGKAIDSIDVTLREDGAASIIDVLRKDTTLPLTLRLEEVGFSGNRSPWGSGQYAFSGNGILEFPVGQERARVTLAMASDSLREADQQSTLHLREAYSTSSELATITVVLEDDDRRNFEAQLPPNTVAFAMSQASVRERDPAVQIDIHRFNPDNTALVVGYVLRNVTATEGEDYFAPASQSISFGPGQRTARLLIPLVQDSDVEGDEAFSIELSSGDSMADIDIYHRIVVMIRDDE